MKRNLYRLVMLALFAVLTGFQLCKVYTTALEHDESCFSIVAKSLVQGKGYAVAVFSTLSAFDQGITSGPVIILPAALLMLVFGNAYWVPGLTAVLLIVSLLIWAFRQLGHVIPSAKWQCGALFLLATMLFTNHIIGFPDENMLVWHALLGEIPSALLVIVATLYISEDRKSPQRLFWGGIIASLGALCKLQSLIGTAALGLYMAASYAMDTKEARSPLRQIFRNLFRFGAGTLLPLLAFEAVKCISIGPEHYLMVTRRLFFFIRDYNTPDIDVTGSAKLFILGQYLGFFAHGAVTRLQYYSLLATLAAIACGTLYGAFRLRRRLNSASALTWATGALLCCTIVHILWWSVICSVVMPRYITQGLFYGCAALALGMGQIALWKTDKAHLLFGILCVLLLYARSDAAEYFWAGTGDRQALDEQLSVRQKLAELTKNQPDTLVFSCGYANSMEYLMPETANFIMCDRMVEPQFAGHKHVLLSYTPYPLSQPEKVLFAVGNSNRVTLRPNSATVASLCPVNDIHSGKYYFIASCRNP